MSTTGPRRPCPACGGNAFSQHTVVRGTPILRCNGCDLATWDWPDFDPATLYDAAYWQSPDATKGYADYHTLAAALEKTNRKRLARIRRQMGPTTGSPRLLDAGCGPGYFVQAARQAGFEATGIEVSAAAVEFARTHLGLDVRPGRVAAGELGSGPYNVVTLWDVLEHLPAPAAALAAIGDVLRPGGLLILSTGDVTSIAARLSGPRWHLYNLPEHLWFFGPRALKLLLSAAGFEALDWRYEVCWYPLRYLAERLESMFHVRRRVSSHLGPLGRLTVPFTLADIVTVTAQRRVSPPSR